jgi:hypothetical protein
MDKIKLYSPTQVLIAAFIGGPFATVYVIWKNFRSLGNQKAAQEALIWGIVFVAAILISLPILPDKFPNYAIPIAYSVGARFFAEKYQMSREAIAASDLYGIQSGWNVAGICIGYILAFLAVGFAWMLALDHFGVVKL